MYTNWSVAARRLGLLRSLCDVYLAIRRLPRLFFSLHILLRPQWYDLHLRPIRHLLFSNIMQIRTQQLRPLDIVSPIQLLIDTMRSIRTTAHRQ